jgi:epoxyqueuosine reductase
VPHKTLLHLCCGPCATATVGHWRERGLDLTGFFYNPNIQPLLEYRRRLTSVRDLADMVHLPLLEDLAYDPADWFSLVGAREGKERCRECIAMRLHGAARRAVEGGFDSFTTSLAISPWQDHEAIAAGGAAAARAWGADFLYEDLRPLYRGSRLHARRLGLYRQKYCGCILSEWERYRGY